MRISSTGLGLALGWFCAAAGSALAACPQGPEDAFVGIALVYDDDAQTVLQRLPGDLVAETVLFDVDEGGGYRVIAIHGLYPVEEYQIFEGEPVEGSREVYRFGDDAPAPAAPTAGMHWSAEMEYADEAGTVTTRLFEVRVGAPEQVRYGACVYPSLPVTTIQHDPDFDITTTFDWLVTLEIPVFRSYAEGDFDPEVYEVLDISVVAE